MSQRTFILGVGAPKTGTTWLYNFLNSYDFSNFGIKKEYHIFDVIHVKSCDFFKPKFNLSEFPMNGFQRKKHERELLLHSFYENCENYFDYFDSLLTNDFTITGDITPTYMLLPAEIFEYINDSFAKRGVVVKVVFFMRDPVSRMISLGRMTKKLGIMSGKNFDKSSPLCEIIDELLCNSGVVATSGYSDCINKLQAVFSDDRLYISFYEKMFVSEEFEALCQFLDVPVKIDWISNKINQSNLGPGMDVSDEYRRGLRNFFDGEYQQLSQIYTKDFIRDLWFVNELQGFQ